MTKQRESEMQPSLPTRGGDIDASSHRGLSIVPMANDGAPLFLAMARISIVSFCLFLVFLSSFSPIHGSRFLCSVSEVFAVQCAPMIHRTNIKNRGTRPDGASSVQPMAQGYDVTLTASYIYIYIFFCICGHNCVLELKSYYPSIHPSTSQQMGPGWINIFAYTCVRDRTPRKAIGVSIIIKKHTWLDMARHGELNTPHRVTRIRML